jgi:hypothetical protein
MTQHQTSRTLVKSAPELWAECSDAASLARHLGAFGEIRITKLEPETAVAWEGTAARGTVKLEPSGWGTRVTLTLTDEEALAPDAAAGQVAPEVPAEAVPPEVSSDPVPPEVSSDPVAPEVSSDPVAPEVSSDPVAPELPSEAEAVAEPTVPPEGDRRRFFGRLLRRLRARTPAPEPELAAPPKPEPAPRVEPEPVTPPEPVAGSSSSGEDALAAALDSLGRAHHRPYSRA